MASLFCSSLLRSLRIVRSCSVLAVRASSPKNHLFNFATINTASSMPSRSWLNRNSIQKSYRPLLGINHRNFSTFFARREEQKTGSCCHAKHNSVSAQQTDRTTPSSSHEHHIEHKVEIHTPVSATDLSFWKDNSVWRRASSNTLRCLIGCSIGDFSAMFYLQAHHTGLPFLAMMAIPMVSGIATSLGFETVVLRIKESMSWSQSLKTAWTMSLISMLTMEFVENIVDMYLTKGMMNFHDPYFWLALIPSLLAGFLAPLPYNYYKLKKFGKSCH